MNPDTDRLILRSLCLAIVSLVTAAMLAAAFPTGSVGAKRSVDKPEMKGFSLEEYKDGQSYYDSDVVRAYNTEADDLVREAASRIPDDVLPESLREWDKYYPKGTPSARSAESPGDPVDAGEAGGGTGGWTALARPYTPSADPDVSYGAGTSWGEMDGDGNMHIIYARTRRTDISQGGDPPGTRFENLGDSFFSTYSGSTWTTPVNLTSISGFEDSSVHYYQVDRGNRAHVVYSQWTWGRDPVSGVYQHEDENFFYRYRSAQGSWSTPRKITNLNGKWGIQGSDFVLRNGRIYGVYTAILNHETAPASYRARVGFVEGLLGDWSTPRTLSQWNYNNVDPGQQQPNGWPSVDVSDVGGLVSVGMGVLRTDAVPANMRLDAMGFHRDAAGEWSGPENLTNAEANSYWLPIFMLYRDGTNTASLLTILSPLVTDATHPVQVNFYFVYNDGSAWSAPENITRVPAGQDGEVGDIVVDPFNRFHFLCLSIRYSWIGGAWTPQGASAFYTRETASGMSGRETLLSYQANRYIDRGTISLERGGGVNAAFSSVIWAGGADPTDYTLYHCYSPAAGSGGAFGSPAVIRGPVANMITELNLSTFPDNQAVCSWLETRFDAGTGAPLAGEIYSRRWSGSSWAARQTVSNIPGNSDPVHSTAAGWPYHVGTRIGPTGEQQWVFETAKYDVGTGTYSDFRKYFAETIDGEWRTPELISDLDVAGEYPDVYVDNNGRVFVLYESVHAPTGKKVVYATNQPDATPPSTTYYFAEGTTRPGFEEWISIQNPNDAQVNVEVTYMLETGETVDAAFRVGAHSRSTVSVNEAVGEGHDVSARVSADGLIMAERPMYFDFDGLPGGHDAIGALSPSRLWYFAEGTTREGFREYLTLQNPSNRRADVDVTYVLSDGSTQTETVEVGPTTRATVDVNAAVGPDQDVSLVVSCADTAIVAERPVYFNYHGWCTGGHDVMGSTALDTLWYFAEGTTRPGFDTYISLQNPYGTGADVHFDFVLEDGSVVDHDMEVGPTSRQTLKVNDVVGEGRDVSCVVTSSSPILAERPMYFLYRDKWTGGHVATGARELANSWFFAEGTTREGFEEWLSLENPSDSDTLAQIDYMLEDGSVLNTEVGVPAHTRVTVDVPLAVGPGRDVSVAIWTDIGIVAERPMYFDYHGMWQGGHDVVGL